MTADRYHLLLTLDGRPAMQGWWPRETTARGRHEAWKRERGKMPGVRITLVDEETGRTLTEWPKAP